MATDAEKADLREIVNVAFAHSSNEQCLCSVCNTQRSNNHALLRQCLRLPQWADVAPFFGVPFSRKAMVMLFSGLLRDSRDRGVDRIAAWIGERWERPDLSEVVLACDSLHRLHDQRCEAWPDRDQR